MCARGLSLAGAVLLLIVCVNASQPLVLHKTPDPPLRRALQGYEDGVCDPARRDEDPDCGGGVPATACARFAGMAMAGGYQGYCMNDAGCMAIQLGQLDRDCAGVQASPPACSQACYATLSSIGANCRAELLQFEYGLDSAQEAYGQPGAWIWRTLFVPCGLDGSGGSSGGVTGGAGTMQPPIGGTGTQQPPATGPPFVPGGAVDGGGSTAEGGDGETVSFNLCDLASEMAEEAGAAPACRNDTACQGIDLQQLYADCEAAFTSPPACAAACNASLTDISEACRAELLAWQEASNQQAAALGGEPVEVISTLLGACDLMPAGGTAYDRGNITATTTNTTGNSTSTASNSTANSTGAGGDRLTMWPVNLLLKP